MDLIEFRPSLIGYKSIIKIQVDLIYTQGNRADCLIPQTGDEMSKRAKFALITWCGNAVNPMKKAKMSLEKTEVKKVVETFSVEFQTSDLEDISLERVSFNLSTKGPDQKI